MCNMIYNAYMFLMILIILEQEHIAMLEENIISIIFLVSNYEMIIFLALKCYLVLNSIKQITAKNYSYAVICC